MTHCPRAHVGQERFGNMTRVYYKEAVGAFIVFDVTRVNTFDAVQKWKKDIDEKVCMHPYMHSSSNNVYSRTRLSLRRCFSQMAARFPLCFWQTRSICLVSFVFGRC